MTPSQLERLPRYAKNEIQKLKSELEAERERVALLCAEVAPDDPSKIMITRSTLARSVPIHNRSRIRFWVCNRWISASLTSGLDGNEGITIRGDDTIMIRPHAANTAIIL